jgi:orotate phosphoribosyltransferase
MEDIIDIMKGVGAIITDSHIVYTSGKHGSAYVNKDVLYPHTDLTSKVCRMFAEKYKDEDIDIVVAPALGGIVLSQWVAHHLSAIKGKEILGVYAEKDTDKNLILTRGYDKLVKGKNILVVEDITNTGGSTKKVIDTVKSAGGNVVAACVMVNRKPKEVNSEMMGVPFSALGIFEAGTYEEADCPLCKANVPINTDVGHGRKYLENKS